MRGNFLAGCYGTRVGVEHEIADVDLPDRLDGALR
jgi:hypothetical protein